VRRPAPRRGARLAIWLGLCGIVFQAILPLLIASTSIAADYQPPMAAGTQSAIHPHHGRHAPAQHAPAGHPHDRGAHCILCLGLHAVGPIALPSAVALAPPADPSDTVGAGPSGLPHITRAATPYASRAPPAIG